MIFKTKEKAKEKDQNLVFQRLNLTTWSRQEDKNLKKKNNKNKPKQEGKNVHLIKRYCITKVSKHSQLHTSITKHP